MTPIIRPATSADIIAFFGRIPDVSVRAWVADLNGEVLGIVGIALPPNGIAIYFSNDTPELLRRHRKTIVRGVRLMLQEVGQRHGVAIQGGEASVLRHFGFCQREDGIWVMEPQHHVRT